MHIYVCVYKLYAYIYVLIFLINMHNRQTQTNKMLLVTMGVKELIQLRFFKK